MNTANYEFYVLNEEKVNVDELLAMEAEERNAVLADAANWTERAKTTDNAADVTTNDLGDATGRIFKLNVSRTDTTGWAACVRIYEAELYATAKPTEPVVDKTILNQLIEQASAGWKTITRPPAGQRLQLRWPKRRASLPLRMQTR